MRFLLPPHPRFPVRHHFNTHAKPLIHPFAAPLPTSQPRPAVHELAQGAGDGPSLPAAASYTPPLIHPFHASPFPTSHPRPAVHELPQRADDEARRRAVQHVDAGRAQPRLRGKREKRREHGVSSRAPESCFECCPLSAVQHMNAGLQGERGRG